MTYYIIQYIAFIYHTTLFLQSLQIQFISLNDTIFMSMEF